MPVSSTVQPSTPALTTAMAELDQALHTREAEWPARGPAWARLNECLDAFAEAVLHEAASVPSNRDEVPHLPSTPPIIIAGPMKSGTTLLTALLDNHPDLVVLPGDTWLRRWLGTGDSPPQNPAQAVRFWLQRVIVPTGQQPFWPLSRDSHTYTRLANTIRQTIDQLADTPGLATFLAGPVAIRQALHPASPAPYRFVEKTPHNEFHADAFARAFPGTTFLHVLRHPLAIAAALKRLAHHRGWAWDIAACARDLRHSFELAARHANTPRYHTVQYEHLLADPDTHLRALADALELPFTESMRTPTIFGRPASSNSMFAERRVQGTLANDTAPEQRWRDTLSTQEIGTVRAITAHAAAPFGYNF